MLRLSTWNPFLSLDVVVDVVLDVVDVVFLRGPCFNKGSYFAVVIETMNIFQVVVPSCPLRVSFQAHDPFNELHFP